VGRSPRGVLGSGDYRKMARDDRASALDFGDSARMLQETESVGTGTKGCVSYPTSTASTQFKSGRSVPVRRWRWSRARVH
jgi:hypothetical protein